MVLTVLSLSGCCHKLQLLRNQVTTISLVLLHYSYKGHKAATLWTHSLHERSDIGVWVCTGFIWLRIGSHGWLLWTRQWIFGFHEKLEISRLDLQLSISQNEMCCMEPPGVAGFTKMFSGCQLHDKWVRIQCFRDLISLPSSGSVWWGTASWLVSNHLFLTTSALIMETD